MTETKKPKLSNSQSQKELDRAEKQFDAFDQQIKEMTHDRLNATAPPVEESRSNLSKKELDNSKEIYLKPKRTVSDNQKFNEKFRDKWNFDKEYVRFIAYHKEITGECIEIWTHPYGGVGAEFWEVPTNKPIWGPRHLAEQIKRKRYHRLVMQQNVTSSDGVGQYYGTMAVDTTIQRLDAEPVSSNKSIFMNAANF
jgi:hypothetical protein